MPEARSALLVGATGLIGSYLLARLIASPAYRAVTVWARSAPGRQDPKLTVRRIDFHRLESERVGAEDVYCALGTTIKRAGSQAEFRRVDYEYPVALARAAARDGARRLMVVSALGAAADSRIFYNRVKGEMEQAVRAAGVATTYFFRPSLLAGPRAKPRLGEQLGLVIGALFGPLLGNYRPIHADLVAAAMLAAARSGSPGRAFESAQIRDLARAG
jgi:uncharacterized protein YbjT (DUF2867 family)